MGYEILLVCPLISLNDGRKKMAPNKGAILAQLE
jgi:hypothetical protein